MFKSLAIVLLTVSTVAYGNVRSFFNHNQYSSYVDPYRGISRSGDNLEEVMIKHINSARRSVYVAVQELRLPLVAKALVEKYKEGVDVRVVLEHDYNFNILGQNDSNEGEYESSKLEDLFAFIDTNRNGKIEKKEMLERDAIYILQQANVPLLDDRSDNSRGSGLMHHKFIVVDDKSVLVSTANFTMSCVHGDALNSSSRGNANSTVVVDSYDFANFFSEEFSQLWGNGRRGNFGQNKSYRGPQTAYVSGVKLTVQFSPTPRRFDWSETVNGLIASHLSKARQSVKAALFVFSDQGLSDVLEKRQNAGAEIGFLIEPKFAYRDYSELLDMMGLQLLNSKCLYEEGNNPWKKPAREVGMGQLSRGDVLHHKFAVVDRRTVIVGSQNWSDSANYTNDETLIVIEDSRVSDSYTREYDRLLSRAQVGPTSRLRDHISSRERDCGI
jgi:phosphatidylserine/phosphatidylglycerophosphate/cardiolipin synthase-like enzyme